jgi:hypothetical protein
LRIKLHLFSARKVQIGAQLLGGLYQRAIIYADNSKYVSYFYRDKGFSNLVDVSMF